MGGSRGRRAQELKSRGALELSENLKLKTLPIFLTQNSKLKTLPISLTQNSELKT
jgi:hypothetical protein